MTLIFRSVCFFLGLFYIGNVHSDEVLVFSEGKNSPIADTSKNVLIEAYGKIGVDVVFQSFPNRRSLLSSSSGLVDGEVHRIKGIDNIEAYSHLVMVPIPINRLDVIVLSWDNNIAVQKIDELSEYSVGIRRGIIYAEQMTNGMDVMKHDKFEQLLRALAFKRTDVALTSYFESLYYLADLYNNKIYLSSPTLATLDLYHYLHVKHLDKVERLTHVLKEMAEKGRIYEIYRQTLCRYFANRDLELIHKKRLQVHVAERDCLSLLSSRK